MGRFSDFVISAFAGLEILFCLSFSVPVQAADTGTGITKTWAIAEFGEPLYGQGMANWPYANPKAPKFERAVLGAFGTYDSLNPYILRGQTPAGLDLTMGSLMVGSGDELSSAYAFIAESVEYPADKSWAVFNLRPEARWKDMTPITADDFLFAFQTIRGAGNPFLQSFYEDVEDAQILGTNRIKFTFRTQGSMKPILAVAGLSPMSRTWWTMAGHSVSQTTLDIPPSSGPYYITQADAGRDITYRRVPFWWAADLPVMKGLWNFNEVHYDYYLDENVMFEAFKAGKIDLRSENRAQRWVTGYNLPQIASGQIITKALPDETPQGIQALFFNLRRPQFQDRRIRQALNLLFDFETIQRQLLYGQYKRCKSYFPNSDFGASGLPTEEEVAILKPFEAQLPPEVLTQAFEPPVTDGTGSIRANMRTALVLFQQAGWNLLGGQLLNNQGQQFSLEFLMDSPSLVRVTEPYRQNLQKVGINANIRVVDSSQYQVRLNNFDFDVISLKSNFFPPPGAELRSYYGSRAANVPGTGNWGGIEDPVVDALIEKVITAQDLDTIKVTTRALDRVLLWGYYNVPQWYNDQIWLAWWSRLVRPAIKPKYGTGFPSTWWVQN